MDKIINGIRFIYDYEDKLFYAEDYGYRFYMNHYANYNVYYGGFDKKIGICKSIIDIGDLILNYERTNKLLKLKKNINGI